MPPIRAITGEKRSLRNLNNIGGYVSLMRALYGKSPMRAARLARSEWASDLFWVTFKLKLFIGRKLT